MRILVTELGQSLISTLKPDPNEALSKLFKEINNTKSMETLESQKSNSFKNRMKYKITDSSNKTNSTKFITVKQQKFNLPKNISERYQETTASSLAATLPTEESVPSKHIYHKLVKGMKHSNFVTKEYSIKSLINPDVFDDMKKSVENKSRTSPMKIEMRSPVVHKNDALVEIERKANLKLSADNANLIDYLKSKKAVSDLLIKQLACYDEERITRLNKVCQRVKKSEEKDQIFTKLVEEKIKLKENTKRDDYRTILARLEQNVKVERDILDRNKPKAADKERYHYVHREIQKTWERYNVNHVNRPKSYKRVVKEQSELHGSEYAATESI